MPTVKKNQVEMVTVVMDGVKNVAKANTIGPQSETPQRRPLSRSHRTAASLKYASARWGSTCATARAGSSCIVQQTAIDRAAPLKYVRMASSPIPGRWDVD